MTHISQIKETMQAVGIPITTRVSDEYEYLFIGAPEDAKCITGMTDNFETTRLDELLRRHKYFEFENGELASWSVS